MVLTLYDGYYTKCESLSCTFLVPKDLEVDLNKAELSFSALQEIHPSDVVTYEPVK